VRIDAFSIVPAYSGNKLDLFLSI